MSDYDVFRASRGRDKRVEGTQAQTKGRTGRRKRETRDEMTRVDRRGERIECWTPMRRSREQADARRGMERDWDGLG
jgi:hypothetical protein